MPPRNITVSFGFLSIVIPGPTFVYTFLCFVASFFLFLLLYLLSPSFFSFFGFLYFPYFYLLFLFPPFCIDWYPGTWYLV